jgi:Acetoacetate decarboxylase (ADC)
MLFGTADVNELAARAPHMERLDAAPVVLPRVWMLQAAFEMPAAARECLLPPGLHPSDPPLAWFVVWQVAESPLGAFTMAELRVSCRSGLRPRGFLVESFVDDAEAGRALTQGWGFRATPAEVRLARNYDVVRATVVREGRPVLDVALRDPDPLGPHDVQFTAAMHLAHTPRGLRLVQVDPAVAVARAERGRPELGAFDAVAWGDARLLPTEPVSASIVLADVTLPALRYLCRPDVWAFDGTERV